MAVNFKYQIKEITPTEGLIKVETKRLQTGITLPFNVYVKDNGVVKKVFNRGNILNKIFLEILEEKGFDYVYLDKTEIKSLEYFLSKKPVKPKVQDIKIAFSNYSFFKEKHYQIEKKLLIPGTEINFPIYNLKNLEFTKIINASDKNPAVITENIFSVEGELVIEEKDIPLYEEYIKGFQDKLAQADIEEEDKKIISNIIFKENSKVVMKELLKDPRSGKKIKEVQNLVENIIKKVIEEPDSIYGLLTLKGYNYYTYTHSINVGVLSIGLGIHIKLEKEKIQKLGIGAMLHDIGKANIPHEILNKQGKLTDTEYTIIKQHVIYGYEIIKENKEVPKESYAAVLQHHEKLTGRGYPYGLKEEEIELFGRITAIADCYDALTTRRPYKAPLTPFFALSILTREKKDYDKSLLIEFIKMLGNIK